MNYIDYIILSIILIFVIKGLFKGLIAEVIGLIGQLLSIMLAFRFMSNMSALINQYISVPATFSTIIGFLAVFIAVHMLFQFLGHLLQKFVQYTFLGWLEKFAGGMVGFTKGAIISSLLVLLVTIIPMSDYFVPDQKNSVLLKPIGKFAPKMFDYLNSVVPNSKDFKNEITESLNSAKQNIDTKKAFQAIEDLLPNEEQSAQK